MSPSSSLSDVGAAVDRVVRARRTRKVLDGPWLTPPGGPETPEARAAFDRAVREALGVAGWAPFHFARTEEVPEPWRFALLDREAMDAFVARFPEVLVGKLPRIFAGAGALVQATWVPEDDPARAGRDWEHAAAAAAAVQNLLLACEARGIGSYWCSAAPLGTPEVLSWCGAAPGERWLGALFLGRPLPAEREAVEGIPGKLRDRRTPPEAGWLRVVGGGRDTAER